MPSHKENKILPYNAKQMLALVMDIENYPQFLPWCFKAEITERINDNHLNAELVINFKAFCQKYSSDVRVADLSKNHPDQINEFEVYVAAIDGPFKNLTNYWHFTDLETDNNSNSVAVEFFIDFEFKSKIFEKMIGVIFEKATRKMIESFEKRAQELYSN